MRWWWWPCAVLIGKVIKSSRHSSNNAGTSTGSDSLPHVLLVHDPAHMGPENSPVTGCVETISALQRLAHWPRYNFVFLFLVICDYGEILLFSGKCVFCLRKYVAIGQPHWCSHCDLGKENKKHWLLEHYSTLPTHTTGVPMNAWNSILESRVFRMRECSLVSSKTVNYQYNLQYVAENCNRWNQIWIICFNCIAGAAPPVPWLLFRCPFTEASSHSWTCVSNHKMLKERPPAYKGYFFSVWVGVLQTGFSTQQKNKQNNEVKGQLSSNESLDCYLTCL